MLLMRLSSKEKFTFLQLAHYIARVDGVFGSDEAQVIDEYCSEMGIDNSIHFDEEGFDLDETLKNFKTEQSKKIAVLELMVLIHIDTKFDVKELDSIAQIGRAFNISEKQIKAYSQWGKNVAELFKEGKELVG